MNCGSWLCSQQVKHISCLGKLEGNPKCSCSSSWHCVHDVLGLSPCWEQSWCPAAVPGSGLGLRDSTGGSLLPAVLGLAVRNQDENDSGSLLPL